MPPVTDNSALSRFELWEDGKLAFADYIRSGEILIIPHVEADPALRGRGAAGRLMTGLLEQARERNLKIRPICSYAATFIARHAEYQDLLA